MISEAELFAGTAYNKSIQHNIYADIQGMHKAFPGLIPYHYTSGPHPQILIQGEVVCHEPNYNYECLIPITMALLDRANTETYGHPTPTAVTTEVEPGPFIVVTGHDLHDLALLLEATKDKGVNIYTHGEMLPCHAYPELKKYPHLKGHFGTAWQNQQKEFKNLPAPVLFTTNCIMPPKASYEDRVFTTSVVEYPGMMHIGTDADGRKDFSPVIEKAIALGGFTEKQHLTGANGGSTMLTGFGHNTVLGVADKVVDAVKSGALKHIFLVGGCDGAKSGRSYYAEFVKATPKDTLVLTLACGKFRFNDLDIGEIGGLPRLIDMGQCNDAYSAIQVAVALADVFKCSVNDLPRQAHYDARGRFEGDPRLIFISLR